MRTHLLKAVYAPTAGDSDTGHAANEPCYARLQVLITTPTSAPGAAAERKSALLTGENDDYVLGGYAGI